MSQKIEIKLKAIDEASSVVANASDKISGDLEDISGAQKQVSRGTKDSEASMKSFATGLSGAATAAFSFYGAIDRVQSAQLSVDRANLQVRSSTLSVQDAQEALTEAISRYGVGSEQANEASEQLSLAQERLAIANERAQQSEENKNQAIMASALQVIPTAITMVDGLSKAWNNMPDVSSLISRVSGSVSQAGITAQTAAVGVTAFMGSFLLADTVLSSLPENIRSIAGALTASIAAIVAATIAWMAFNGTMTVGVAVPIILAAVGAGIAGIKAAVPMANGGVVSSPIVALVGEAGPEIVMPISQYESQHSQQTTSKFCQNVTYLNFTQTINGNIETKADEDRIAQKTIDKLDSELTKRR